MEQPDFTPLEATLCEQLKKSDLFLAYQEAFRTATGLPLRLMGPDKKNWSLDDNHVNRSPFCELLNPLGKTCNSCLRTNQNLMEEVENGEIITRRCFAGLYSTVVPVKMGKQTIGYLRTGQVFSEVPSTEDFEKFLTHYDRSKLSDDLIAQLKEAYFNTKVVAKERYDSMVILLSSFALQLGQQAETLAIAEQGSEPGSVSKARRYIIQNLGEPLSLEDVAGAAGLSESHFCRVFKEATGLTLTQFVRRQRIMRAKKLLLNPDARVSEIAWQIGFRSLSQFNRCFARIAGESPTSWRQKEQELLSTY